MLGTPVVPAGRGQPISAMHPFGMSWLHEDAHLPGDRLLQAGQGLARRGRCRAPAGHQLSWEVAGCGDKAGECLPHIMQHQLGLHPQSLPRCCICMGRGVCVWASAHVPVSLWMSHPSVGTMGERAQGGTQRVLDLRPDLWVEKREQKNNLGCPCCSHPAGPPGMVTPSHLPLCPCSAQPGSYLQAEAGQHLLQWHAVVHGPTL